MSKFSYGIESRAHEYVPAEYKMCVYMSAGGIVDGKVLIYETEWTPDRLEAYHDGMQYVKSLIDDACKLRKEILGDVGEMITNEI